MFNIPLGRPFRAPHSDRWYALENITLASAPRLLHWPHEKTNWKKNHARDRSCFAQYRNNGALLLTDADAKRRSSAQGNQAAGASGSWCAVHPRHGGENCGYTSFDQCWATIGAEGGWCRPNPFPGTPYGIGYTWSGPKR